MNGKKYGRNATILMVMGTQVMHALTQTHPLKLGTLMFGLKGDVKSLIDWSFGGGTNPATL